MKNFLATKKGKIIFAVAAALVLVVIAFALLIVFSPKAYRSISVEEVQGTALVVNTKNNGEAYKGQRLYGGDDVTVLEKSYLTMCLDNSKYLYADENTHFYLENSSTNNASRIRIILDEGSVLNELTEKLNPDDSYEVDTPSATMSVRGTKFRVTVYIGEDGLTYTLLEVENGIVLAQLKNADGTYNGVEKEFGAGESVLICTDADSSEFVDNEGKEDDGKAEETKPQETKTAEKHTHTQGEFEVSVEPGCDTKGEQVAKCTECGEVLATEEIEPLGHQFSKWTTVTEATCQTEGTESRKCSQCGKSETRAVAIKEHNWSDWTVVSQPTCASEGVEERTCLAGGEKESRSVPATGAHNWGNFVQDVAGNCTTDSTGHYTCTICGAAGSHVTIPAPGHDYNLISTEKISENKIKYTFKCKNCSATYEQTATN